MADGGDLETYLLKWNTLREKDSDEVGPQARSEWVDEQAGDDEKEVDMAWEMAKKGAPEPLQRMQAQAQATKNGAGGKAMQTGPKGVKADYEQAKKDWAEIRYQQNLQHQLNIDRITHGVTIVEFEDEAPPPEGHTIELNQYESDDDELLEGFEEDFMAQYREKRMAQLQEAATRPLFGEIKEVVMNSYIEQVDKCDPRVCVVVHIYCETRKECRSTNRTLELIARSHPRVKFLRMNVRESPLEIDPLVLPMFNVYKGGELSECIAVKEELGMNFEVGDLEWLLENHGVLDVTSKSDMPLPPQQASRHVGRFAFTNEDGED